MHDPTPVTTPRRGGTRILAIGDLVPENEFGLLLDAFADVSEWQPHARLILMGDGPECDALQARISEDGIADSVGLLEALDHARTAEFMQRAHVCLIPGMSTGGSIPPALPVAMAGGLCVIGALGGVAASLIEDGVNGLLVRPGSYAELSRALHLVLSNAGLRRRLGENAASSIHDGLPRRISA